MQFAPFFLSRPTGLISFERKEITNMFNIEIISHTYFHTCFITVRKISVISANNFYTLAKCHHINYTGILPNSVPAPAQLDLASLAGIVL